MLRAVDNPPNPWQNDHVEWLDEPPKAALQVFEEQAKSILSRSDSPDLGFRVGVNPYRGCYHACSYCYARKYHTYLGFGSGTDFDRKIVVKVNAAQLLRKELSSRTWKQELICFSGATDCYQPLEAAYQITRECLRVCLEKNNPVTIITKGSIVRRDIDLLSELSQRAFVSVYLSIPFLDDALRKLFEPNASSIDKRFETVQRLADAGIQAGISLAPVIPGLNDSDMPKILARAKSCGANHAFMSLLRLSEDVFPVFVARLEEAAPARFKKVMNSLGAMRHGKFNDSTFGRRMQGDGPRWDIINQLFDSQCNKLGFDRRTEIVANPESKDEMPLSNEPKRQLTLF